MTTFLFLFGAGLLVAGFWVWLGLPAGLLAAGVLLSGLAVALERGSAPGDTA
jgi:hypothetical protein